MIIHWMYCFPFSPPQSPSFCSLFLPSLSLHWLGPPPSPLPTFMQFDKPVSAHHLKLVILQGFEHFVSVYSIGSCGTPVQEQLCSQYTYVWLSLTPSLLLMFVTCTSYLHVHQISHVVLQLLDPPILMHYLQRLSLLVKFPSVSTHSFPLQHCTHRTCML